MKTEYFIMFLSVFILLSAITESQSNTIQDWNFIREDTLDLDGSRQITIDVLGTKSSSVDINNIDNRLYIQMPSEMYRGSDATGRRDWKYIIWSGDEEDNGQCGEERNEDCNANNKYTALKSWLNGEYYVFLRVVNNDEATWYKDKLTIIGSGATIYKGDCPWMIGGEGSRIEEDLTVNNYASDIDYWTISSACLHQCVKHTEMLDPKCKCVGPYDDGYENDVYKCDKCLSGSCSSISSGNSAPMFPLNLQTPPNEDETELVKEGQIPVVGPNDGYAMFTVEAGNKIKVLKPETPHEGTPEKMCIDPRILIWAEKESISQWLTICESTSVVTNEEGLECIGDVDERITFNQQGYSIEDGIYPLAITETVTTSSGSTTTTTVMKQVTISNNQIMPPAPPT